MQIARFATKFDTAAKAVGNAGHLLRGIREGTGDLPTRVVFGGLQSALASAKSATVDALEEVKIDPARANSILPDFPGGPQSVTELQAGALDIEAKALAFNVAFAGWFSSLSITDVYEIGRAGEPGKEYSRLSQKQNLAEALVAPLRAMPELDALIAAFEAVGG